MSEDELEGIHLPQASCICLLVYSEGITFTPKLLQKMYLSHENSAGTDKQPSKKCRVKNTTVNVAVVIARMSF